MKLRDLEAIQGPMFPMIYHGLHMHRKVKHAYLFGPSRYRCMDIETFTVSMNVHLWEMLLDHLKDMTQ